MTDKLKDCPFCGREGQHCTLTGWVSCSSPKCPAYGFVGDEKDWNTRALPAVEAAEIEVVACELFERMGCIADDEKCIQMLVSALSHGAGVNQQAGSGVREYSSYTTTPGESVAGIALRQLKDESRWVEIRDLNAHAFPCILAHEYYPVGTVLRMPLPPSPAAKAVQS